MRCNTNHPYPALKEIINMWIEEHTAEDILSNYPQYGLGDIFSYKRDIARVFGLFQALANYCQRKIYWNNSPD